MDINSLLSPQETPRATPNPPQKAPTKRTRKPRGSRAPNAPSSTSAPTSTPTYNGTVPAQRPPPTPLPARTSSGGRNSITSTPSQEGPKLYRQPSIASSTAGMDTLADLASMQHHQQTARVNAGGLKSAEIFDSPKSSATSLPNLHNMTRSEAASRLRAGSFDVTMADSPQHTPPPRTYTSKALSESELRAVTEAANRVQQNSFAHDGYVELINLLHLGLLSHIRLQSTLQSSGDPRSYELLRDLQAARESMSSRFAMGEILWADWVQDQILLAVSFEDKIAVRELCERAVGEEDTSSTLWLIYGQWMQSEYSRLGALEERTNGARSKHNQLMSEEERAMAAEFFGRQQVHDVWQRGAQKTTLRINDSHQIWDPYLDILLQDLETSPTPKAISSLRQRYMDRLQTPHATWDNTSSKLSTFISSYDNQNWEMTMVQANRLGGEAKHLYDMRDFKEVDLLRAGQSGDATAELRAFQDYIDYELGLSRKKGAFRFELANALFQRATLRFPSNTELWEAYTMFLHEESVQQAAAGLSIPTFLEKATRHCPWSGTLWSQYIIAAEIARMPFSDIGDIKHRATSSGILEVGDMDEVLKITTAWCGYLRRRAFTPQATDEDMDVAEVGIRSAIEDLENLGVKKYGKEYQGDPDYRLEKIYIKYLTQARNWSAVRETFRRLIPRKGHDYDFWLRFYVWEMITWSKLTYSESNPDTAPVARPTEATKVLQQAMRRTDLNWPERILQMYLVHCEDHEDAEHLQMATVDYWRQTNVLKRKRQQEVQEQYQYQQQLAQLQSEPPHPSAATSTEDVDIPGKRKRGEEDDVPRKKSRPDAVLSVELHTHDQSPSEPSLLKRDRENATVIASNLPANVTEIKVRQFFRDCGKINSLKLSIGDHGKSVASVEFEMKEDVQTALTKNMKLLDGSAIEVEASSGSTLYICNFPPAADEIWIREKFQRFGDIVDVRFPSLKYNTHRRFAYVEFRHSSDAQAATQLDGEKSEGGLALLAKLSDPAHKQQRHGPMEEGRELFVSNIPPVATWKDLKQLFCEYGYVESARIPRKFNGDSLGIGFVVFRQPHDAQKALILDQTSWKGRVLKVAESTNDPNKRHANVDSAKRERSTTSPASGRVGPSPSRAPSFQPDTDKKLDIKSRTFALLNVPDTVNDARIRLLTEPYGELVKILLRPDHQGAIVEYKDQASVGKASLGLEGHEIAQGRYLSVGTVQDLKQQKEEVRTDKLTARPKKNVTALPTPSQVRRPGMGAGRRGGKGGLGVKRGGVGLDGDRAKTNGDRDQYEDKQEPSEKVLDGKPKNNADFKAILLGS